MMIVRMWQRRVPTYKADAYADVRRVQAMTDYGAVEGFADPEVEKAIYYPEDEEYLLEFEPSALYYEVIGREPAV